MTTADYILEHTEGWRAFVPTSEGAFLSVIRGISISYRFGIASSSEGVLLKPYDLLKVDETVYIKEIDISNNQTLIAFTT